MIRALYAEDDPNDLELITFELNGLATVMGAQSKATFSDALKQSWDVILLDLRIPGLDGRDALKMAKEVQPLTPVIIVTGSVDEETVSVACREGAVDYMRKDRLNRLRMAVQNAVENAERKKREIESKKKEAHNERMDLLGGLVVGLSHDIRNVLSVILAGVEIIRPKIDPSDGRILDVMTSSVKRAEAMLVQILTFGRGDNGELHKVDTEHVVGEIRSLLRAGTFPANIRVQVSTAIGTAQIRCDETQINRALWNLCINAREAMLPGGGQLTIAAQNVTESDGSLFVCITVRDTGTGIPKAAMARLFEPFFTTKGAGGTGLGLAMTQQIIKAHGGRISVASDVGWTEFSVFLPVAGEAQNHLADFDGRGRVVLLVEDEDFLRAWEKLRLENANYKVLDAQNGAAAMTLFLQHIDEISVLVTDVNMPVMQGPQLAQALLELKPALSIVYVTGLDRTTAYSPVPSAILEKPFASVKLLEVLRDVLPT